MSDPENDPAPATQGPVGRVLRSAGEFLASLLAIGRTRLELLTVELQLELRRLAELVVLAFVALLAAGIGLVMAGIGVIVAFWDTHRVLAAVGVTAAFLLIAGVAAGVLLRRLRSGPRPLAGTLDELARDVNQLRGGA